jgi:acyl-coenzyme A thioesterase PaaI-like protein
VTTNDGTAFDPELMAAVIDLGGAMRALVDASTRTTVGAADLRLVAETVRAATARLTVSQRSASQLPALDDPIAFRRVYSPVTGVGSGIAPPLVIRRHDGEVVAEATLGLAYEGPPSYLHGGMSALFMDQLLGSAAIAAGLWGMTAHLELDYRRPVPLETPLVLRARVAENVGRKSVITGDIALAAAPDESLVEARGVFVTPRPEKSEAYFGSITDASGQHRPPGRPTDATALERD